jgi:thioredoxin reductase
MLGRCCRSVLVCHAGEPRNAKARALHNYLTRDGIAPVEFLRLARTEIAQYPSVEFRQVEILDARRTGSGFIVVCSDSTQLECRKLLLATGVVDDLPDIEGLAPLYGTSVHHCPYCDAWEWRDQPIAVYGRGEEGCNMALGLSVWTDDIVLCTDGSSGLTDGQLELLQQRGIEVREEPLVRLEGQDGWLEKIILAGADPLLRRALFLCLGQRQRSGIAGKLGCHFTARGAVATGSCEATDVPGLYVAGDSSKEAQFAIVAAAEGAEAGMAINKALLKEDLAQNKSSTPRRISRGGPYAKSG